MDLTELLGDMEEVTVSKEEFDKMYILDSTLERDESDVEQISIIKLRSAVDIGDGRDYMLEVFKKGNRVNANMTIIKVDGDEIDHGKELEKFLDDPSDVGC